MFLLVLRGEIPLLGFVDCSSAEVVQSSSASLERKCLGHARLRVHSKRSKVEGKKKNFSSTKTRQMQVGKDTLVPKTPDLHRDAFDRIQWRRKEAWKVEPLHLRATTETLTILRDDVVCTSQLPWPTLANVAISAAPSVVFLEMLPIIRPPRTGSLKLCSSLAIGHG